MTVRDDLGRAVECRRPPERIVSLVRNVCADEPERYCRVPLEDVAQRRPELILLPDEPFPFRAKHLPELEALVKPQGPVQAVRFVDGRALSWYGSRTPARLKSIRRAIHEDRE